MGILNNLWTKVWHDESRAKQLAFETEVREFMAEAEARRDALTEKQKAALKHGGIYSPGTYTSSPYHLPPVLAGAGGAAAQNNLNALYQQSLLAQSMQNPNQAGTAVLGTNPSVNIPYPSTAKTTIALGSSPYPAGWDNGFAGTFYMALRGIEQASMQKPKGNFDYDDVALGIQDYRKFNGDEIDLLGLTSFCLSNLMEVEPVVLLLEGYGMKVV